MFVSIWDNLHQIGLKKDMKKQQFKKIKILFKNNIIMNGQYHCEKIGANGQ